ncbi:hypothetical protein [Pseudescherichia sp.]|uniref:hypothetical protein n=1 Tax=Pseudescherichia sp. TaxID=2055881 RepID=UPI002898519A|nr:hypothetical protein [Pseudescherichia sp.]
MNTFSIIAIPFFITAIIFLILAVRQKKSVWLIAGCVFMCSSVTNAVIGMTL